MPQTIRFFDNPCRIPSEQYCAGLTVQNAAVSHDGHVKEGTVVTVTCTKPQRYTLMGEKKVTCQSTGDWSAIPECRKCGKVY